MVKRIFSISFFFLIIPFINIQPQSIDSLAIYYYKERLKEINNNDAESAEDSFKKSIKEEDNPAAEYELAKIYRADTSHYSWNLARQHIKKAIKLDPDNPGYHLFYGLLAEDLYHYSWIEFETIDDAVREYKKTLELDSTNIVAAEKLAVIENKKFLEFNNSISLGNKPYNYNDLTEDFQEDINIPYQAYIQLGKVQTQQHYNNIMPTGNLSYSKYAKELFKTTESACIIAVKYDSLNPRPYLTLSSIYEDNNEPGKGISYLRKLVRIYPSNKDAHLYLGLLYYRTSQLDSAYSEYQRAIYLMDKTEKDDFIYNSVKVLIEPFLKGHRENLDERTLKQIINLYWKERDPLNLSPYNERLLEHYTRVAYSNLRFSVPNLNATGWKTDRGIVVIRYGIPPDVIRIRPAVVVRNGVKTNPETEIWKYPDKTFSFVDLSRNGEYIYGVPGESQYWDDTQQFAKDLLVTQPEEYHPKFEGPIFSVPNAAYQLKDFDKDNLTDLFIGYGIKLPEKIERDRDLKYEHTTGIFLFDSYFRKIAENKSKIEYLNDINKIEIPDSGILFINAEKLISRADSGNLAFEIMRVADKGVSSYHGKFKLRSFNSSSLDMSDIVLASIVDRDKKIAGRINRSDYSILPNPTGIFSEDQNLYIYYEVYNLEKDERGLTDFQQTIILQKKGEEDFSIGKLAGSVLKFIGIKGDEQRLGLTSKYQTKEKDSKIYLQLDMNGYEPGNYILSVRIKDNISGRETEQISNLIWK